MASGDWGAVGRLIERFEAAFTPPLSEITDGFYSWVSLPLTDFLAGMRVAQQYLIDRDRWDGRRVFLDVGCGIGSKLVLASELGWRTAGIEMYPAYVESACALCPSTPIYQVNAFDFAEYGRADLVYSYRLCASDEEQERLTAHIIGQMEPLSLLFLARCPDPEGLEPLGEGVWVKP